MKFSTLSLLTKEGAKNVSKNKLMSFASIMTITVTLFTLGLLLLIISNVTTNLSVIKRDLQVGFYLKVDASAMESEEVSKFINDKKGAGIISEYQYETKAQGYENATKDLLDPSLTKGLSQDNFAEGYFFKLVDPNVSDQIIADLKLLSGVDQDFITYPKETLDKLTRIMQTFQYASLFTLAVLLVISILLISNTIRLTVYSRRKEIEIMKFVGAYDRFIRFPFIVEGMLIGFLGSICSFILTSQSYNAIKSGLNVFLSDIGIPNLAMIEFGLVALMILVLNLIFGITIGAIGSFLSVRKHLNV